MLVTKQPPPPPPPRITCGGGPEFGAPPHQMGALHRLAPGGGGHQVGGQPAEGRGGEGAVQVRGEGGGHLAGDGLLVAAGWVQLGPAVDCHGLMVGHQSLSEVGQEGQTLAAEGIPVVRVTTCRQTDRQTSSPELVLSPCWEGLYCLRFFLDLREEGVGGVTDLAGWGWRPGPVVRGNAERAELSPAELETKKKSQPHG